MQKTAIVTGSSRGIGFGILKRLGRDGFRVVMVATGSQEKNQKALDELKEEGNGGIFYSMAKKGIIDDMKSKKIKWIFIGSVDNLLVKYVDTLLLGLAIKQNVNIATRTVIKNSPNERVGVLCKKNGKVKVIEYTEVPKEMMEAVFQAGLPIGSMSVSALTKYALGDPDEEIRKKAMQIAEKSIELAVDLGVRTVMIPGYDIYFGESTIETKKYFLENVKKIAEIAEREGILVGFETGLS